MRWMPCFATEGRPFRSLSLKPSTAQHSTAPVEQTCEKSGANVAEQATTKYDYHTLKGRSLVAWGVVMYKVVMKVAVSHHLRVSSSYMIQMLQT